MLSLINGRSERGFLMAKTFNRVIINGQSVVCSGNSRVTVTNNSVIIDDNVIKSGITDGIYVIVQGDVEQVTCEGSVEIRENCGIVECGGNCSVGGLLAVMFMLRVASIVQM